MADIQLFPPKNPPIIFDWKRHKCWIYGTVILIRARNKELENYYYAPCGFAAAKWVHIEIERGEEGHEVVVVCVTFANLCESFGPTFRI